MNPELLNKIHCADSFEFIKKLPDKCIDLILTDPPYGMEFQSGYRKEKHLVIENDDNLDWLPEFIAQCYRVLKNDTHAYFFCSFHNVDIFKQEISKQLEVKNILVWYKNNTGMGDLEGDYAPQYEFCIYARKGNKKLNGGRDSNVLRFAKTNNELHPTQKPLDLISFLCRKSSEEGGVVFDPFIGSGTTALASKILNRNFIGVEMEQKYVDIANERLRVSDLQTSMF